MKDSRMTGIIDHFRCNTFEQEILFAPNARVQLGDALERFGCRRILLCTNRSMSRGGHVRSIESILGDRLVAVYAEVQPHVQDVQVDEVLALAIDLKADAIVGMGGGSPIGMAKAVASRFATHPGGHSARAATPGDRLILPVAAIPTTYSGSEMTAVYGITQTRETPPRKVTVSDPNIVPKLVIYDPVLTLDLPPEMTASSGINALAHCLEALYSITRNPLSTAAALSGVRHISSVLLRCFTNGDDLDARTEMLLGAYMAGISLAHTTMGLHHGLCHVLGGTANVPHGIANAIILPHAIRFNAGTVSAELLPVAEAIGIALDDRAPKAVMKDLVDRLVELVGDLRLPHRLRDTGVKEADLPTLAEIGFQNRTVQNNPRPITDAAQIEQMLREAW